MDLSNRRWLFYSLFFLVGVGLILFITAPYGAGISGDSVDYLSTADSLKKGAGFTDYMGEPYIYWPPLYPILLGGLSVLSGLDTFIVGWWLNAICFGVIVVQVGTLFRDTFENRSSLFILGAMLVLTSLPLISLAANITSDPFFIVLVLTYAILGRKYLSSPDAGILFFLSLITGLAAIQRWHGFILIVAMIIIVFIAGWQDLKQSLLHAFWAGALASVPFLSWVWGRNHRLLGSFLGYRDTLGINYLHNLRDSLRKIAHWFVPDQILRLIPPLLLLFILILFLLMINNRKNWHNFFEHVTSRDFLPWLIFAPIYYSFVILTSIAYDHPAYFDDRYYAPLFVPIILLLAIIIRRLVLPALRRLHDKLSISQDFSKLLLVSIAVIWLVYPGYRIYKYCLVSRSEGVASYNIYNTRQYHESRIVKFLQEQPLTGELLYSNYPPAVYVFTDLSALRAPISPSADPEDLDKITEVYDNWPAGDSAYLIWFLPNDWHYYYYPQDLVLVADMEELFSSSDGVVYLVTKR